MFRDPRHRLLSEIQYLHSKMCTGKSSVRKGICCCGFIRGAIRHQAESLLQGNLTDVVMQKLLSLDGMKGCMTKMLLGLQCHDPQMLSHNISTEPCQSSKNAYPSSAYKKIGIVPFASFMPCLVAPFSGMNSHLPVSGSGHRLSTGLKACSWMKLIRACMRTQERGFFKIWKCTNPIAWEKVVNTSAEMADE